MISRFRKQLAAQNWSAAVMEVMIVIVGILVALQVDDWVKGQNDRRLEQVYLKRLKADLVLENELMNAAIDYATSRLEAVRLLDRMADIASIDQEPPARVVWAVETASWRSFPQVNASVYRDLQGSGRLVLIRSDVLRESLAEHYALLQHSARVGLDREAQNGFDLQTAGLLNIDELVALETNSGDWEDLQVSSARAMEIAVAFRDRELAVALLPGLAQHHIFNSRVIGQMQARANAIVQQIDELIKR
jgi:hypothetical protein